MINSEVFQKYIFYCIESNKKNDFRVAYQSFKNSLNPDLKNAQIIFFGFSKPLSKAFILKY